MNIKKTLAAVVAIIALSTLGGCIDAPPPPKAERMMFQNVQPLLVDAARVEIRNDYKPSVQAPFVEHLFPNPPAIAAEAMISRQVAASGMNSNNILRVIIVDGPVKEERLPLKQGIVGTFTKEPETRLDAKLLVKFELATQAAPDIVIGHADIAAARTKYVMKGASPAEREKVYNDLVREMMADVANGVKSAVENTFGKKTY